jgi:hypothetical protein
MSSFINVDEKLPEVGRIVIGKREFSNEEFECYYAGRSTYYGTKLFLKTDETKAPVDMWREK